MKLLITGGGGFVGSRLARSAARARPRSAARRIERLVLADQVAPPPPTCSPTAASRRRVGPLLDQCDALARRSASTASSTSPRRCRASARPTSTSACARTSTARARCSTRCAPACRPAAQRRRGSCSRARSRCSGPIRRVPLPALRRRRHAARAADLVRHAQAGLRAPDRRLHAQGLHRRPRRAADDGDRAAGPAERRRVVVLLRHHPRAARRRGSRSVRCRADVSHPVTSPARTVEGLIAVYEASRESLRRPHSRLNLPALNVRVAEMLDALEKVAGPAVRERVRFVRDETHRRHRRQLAGAARPPSAPRGSACKPTQTSPTSSASTSPTAAAAPTRRSR